MVMSGDDGAAVSVRGAYKRYSTTAVVLRGLDLTVNQANIYGLLGPSGCGKSTLLRSIVGMVRLDAGEISVKAKTKSNVGYMPQELGLFGFMTIMEVFQFYGRIFGMDQKDVLERGNEYVQFLELPASDRFVNTLSGGQQRRLSFAVTLIHDPDLLILDEPTVGIDPILSAAIWERLVEMTTCQRKTIIITTHYIEEARQAHMIGLMRDGVLLAEQSPQTLMNSQGVDSLEAAFLLLSQRQEVERPSDRDSLDSSYPEVKKKTPSPLTDTHPVWKLKRYHAQVRKHMVWASRYIGPTLFFLLLPALTSILVQAVLSHNPGSHRSVGIVSSELPGGMVTCDTLPYGGCDNYERPFSCRLMDYLKNSTITPVLYPDMATARASALRNEVWGILEFSANYTESSLDRVNYDVFSVPDGVVDASFITGYMDMSNMWISTFLQKEIIEDVQEMIRGFLSDCNENPKLLEIPLQMQPAVYGSNKPTFIQFFIPGIMCTFSFYLAIMYTSGAIMFEKSVGLERSMVAGMTKLEVIMAHCTSQVVVAIFQECTVIFVFYYMFDNECRGSVALLSILLFMMQTMGCAYGLVLGMFCSSERDAMNAATGTVNALFMIAGLMWPMEGMHYLLRNVIWAVPVQPAVEAFRAIVMRDWSLTHPIVAKGFLSTTVWTAIFIVMIFTLARGNKTTL